MMEAAFWIFVGFLLAAAIGYLWWFFVARYLPPDAW